MAVGLAVLLSLRGTVLIYQGEELGLPEVDLQRHQLRDPVGDLVELETEPLGRLHVNIRDDLKRTWARETRLQRQEKGLEGFTPQLTGKYAKN